MHRKKTDKSKKKEIEKIVFENNTPKGEKKDVSKDSPAAYHPQYVEMAWYDWWEKSGFFKGDNSEDDTREKVWIHTYIHSFIIQHLFTSLSISIYTTLLLFIALFFFSFVNNI